MFKLYSNTNQGKKCRNKKQDIFFEEDNSPEAIDKKIAQTNIDHLNGLKTALDHNALNHRELETNVKILVEAAPTAILKGPEDVNQG
jgi:hypothetical protein